MSWLDKLIEAVKKWLAKEKPEPTPEPQPQPEPSPQPGPDGATDRIDLVSWDARAIRWRGAVRTWPTDGDLSGEAHLEIFRDGRWQGGKFEHCRNAMTDRGWGNIKSYSPEHNQPYGVFKTLRLAVGEKARFRLISYDSKQFTNWLESTWK